MNRRCSPRTIPAMSIADFPLVRKRERDLTWVKDQQPRRVSFFGRATEECGGIEHNRHPLVRQDSRKPVGSATSCVLQPSHIEMIHGPPPCHRLPVGPASPCCSCQSAEVSYLCTRFVMDADEGAREGGDPRPPESWSEQP